MWACRSLCADSQHGMACLAEVRLLLGAFGLARSFANQEEDLHLVEYRKRDLRLHARSMQIPVSEQSPPG